MHIFNRVRYKLQSRQEFMDLYLSPSLLNVFIDNLVKHLWM